ncbi:unnamed protein product [Notodromas monacha]|uniref:Major facilitator superfamily (MFS) profile domain-containing protein n=1 Tax=Notodromas monacha TaxID=399045 RepID=A0A7R9GCT8_9CRUS|nr:unnamed protein product [Notodromas monacha]CAG0918006.1 unnamed protein product [Notodromas monacha]
MTPFFPLEASVKMVQESTIGFIFSANALTSTILSPIVGHFIIPKLGRKFVLFSGAWITGGAIIAFGFLDEIMDTSVFVQMCLIVRVVEAVGVSMCLTAGFSFLAQSFNEDIGFVMGLSEMSVGIGYLFGPSIGGSLYDIGGYELPFWLLGFTLLVSIPLIMYLLRNIDNNGDKRVSRRPTEAAVEIASHEAKPYELPSGLQGSQGRRPRVFPSFRFCFFACYVTFNAVTISFLETTLEPHLRPLGMSPGMVGLFFVVLSICYLAFGLVSASISRRPTEAAVEIASHEAKPYELPSGLRGSQGRRPRVFPSFRFCFFACYVTFNAVTISFLETTLEPHLRPRKYRSRRKIRKKRVDPYSGPYQPNKKHHNSYTIDRKPEHAGSISDRFQESQGTFCVIGMLCEAVAFLLVGPTPLLGLESSVMCHFNLYPKNFGYAPRVGQFLGGKTRETHFGVGYRKSKQTTPQDEDDAVNIAMYSSVAGIWQSAYSFGEFIGPAVGGVMLENVQYPWSASIFGLLCLSSGVHWTSCWRSHAGDTRYRNQAVVETQRDGKKTLISERPEAKFYVISKGSKVKLYIEISGYKMSCRPLLSDFGWLQQEKGEKAYDSREVHFFKLNYPDKTDMNNIFSFPLRIFEINLALIPRVASRSSKAGLVGGVEAVRRCRNSRHLLSQLGKLIAGWQKTSADQRQSVDHRLGNTAAKMLSRQAVTLQVISVISALDSPL